MKQETLIAGFGGQGILMMGRLLAEAAMNEGYYATWFPSYGPEMRGGTANCTTIFSDEEIGSPIAGQFDVVIAMNQPSLERFGPCVRPGGLLLLNTSMIPVNFERSDIDVLKIDTLELARRIGQERVANVVILGALLAARATLRAEAFALAIASVIGEKKPELIAANTAALRAGREAAEQQFIGAGGSK